MLSGVGSIAEPPAARSGVEIVSSGGAEPIAEMLARRGWTVGPIQSFVSAAPSGGVIVLHPDRDDRERALQLCLKLSAAPGPAVLFLQPGEDTGWSVQALDIGADDSLAAPHNLREVVARVHALHRRVSRRVNARHIRLGSSGARFDATNRTVTTADGPAVTLTDRQAKLLTALVRRPDAWVSRAQLLDEVMGPDGEAFERAIDVLVCRLKHKLGEAGLSHLIASSRGAGYRLNATPQST